MEKTVAPGAEPKYKFKELRIYNSAEWLAEQKHKYRQVFDRYNTAFVYVEQAISREPKQMPEGALGMLYDSTLCIGCQACVSACRAANDVELGHVPAPLADWNAAAPGPRPRIWTA